MTQNDTGVTLPEQTPTLRADALRTAREVLLVKAGKYAERDLDPMALVTVASFILSGSPVTVATGFDLSVNLPEGVDVQAVMDGIEDVLADVIPFDDGNGAGLKR